MLGGLRSILACAALVVLSACATDSATPPPVSAPPGMASITIARPMALGATLVSAEIDINGAKVTDLASGQTYSANIPPGPITITVSCWCGPGHYSTSFTAAPGGSYRFVVSPRLEQAGAQITGGLIGLAIDTAANGDRSGTFKITSDSQ